MKKLMILSCILFTLGCSMMTDLATKAVGGVIGADDSGLEVELDAQIGDRATEADTQVGGKATKGTGNITASKGAKVQVLNRQHESNIEKAETVHMKNENIPPWVLFVLLAGWILPDPARIWSWLYGKLTFRKKV